MKTQSGSPAPTLGWEPDWRRPLGFREQRLSGSTSSICLLLQVQVSTVLLQVVYIVLLQVQVYIGAFLIVCILFSTVLSFLYYEFMITCALDLERGINIISEGT